MLILFITLGTQAILGILGTLGILGISLLPMADCLPGIPEVRLSELILNHNVPSRTQIFREQVQREIADTGLSID